MPAREGHQGSTAAPVPRLPMACPVMKPKPNTRWAVRSGGRGEAHGVALLPELVRPLRP